MISLRALLASMEVQQTRQSFEDMGAHELGKIWEGLLRVSRDCTQAIAVQAFTSDGEPGEHLVETPTPEGPGVRAAVHRVLKTGVQERSGHVFVFPVVYRGCVFGAIALAVVASDLGPETLRRLETALRIAGFFLAAAAGAENENRLRAAMSGFASGDGEDLLEGLPGVIATGQAMNPVIRMARRFAEEDEPVLMTGEEGVGKDTIARGMHEHGPRRKHEFHEVTVPATHSSLFEAEMFGVAEGSATNVRAREGHFQAAGQGTLFLNEIGDTPLDAQAKLLRVIEKREFNPVGSTKTIKLKAGIIAATNKDLPRMIRDNEFRRDLFDRLNVLPLHVPPLREHLQDIPRLVKLFAKRWKGGRATPGALVAFMKYHWPGNIRELKNRTTQLMILGKGRFNEADARANLKIAESSQEPERPRTQSDRVREAKGASILESLTRHEGDKQRAADELRICVRALEKQVVEFGLRAIVGPNFHRE